uniref:Uncharacterized protein n=1 Tax=Anguilla anguilla TaxID=7936 RepID=A0A0E9UAL0_ANGAN
MKNRACREPERYKIAIYNKHITLANDSAIAVWILF